MCVFTIIPVLPVEESCNWCEPQHCYTASVWWGECLLSFWTKHAERLTPERLNDEACEVLRQLSMALTPDSDDIISPDALIKRMKAHALCCFWADFRPALAMAYPNQVVIPLQE